MALTAEEQLKKLKEREKKIKEKIRREKEKEKMKEFEEIKKYAKYLKFINLEDVKKLVDVSLNKTHELIDYDRKPVKCRINEEDLKILIKGRLESFVYYSDIDKIETFKKKRDRNRMK